VVFGIGNNTNSPFWAAISKVGRPVVSSGHVTLSAIAAPGIRGSSGRRSDRLRTVALGPHRRQRGSGSAPQMAASDLSGAACCTPAGPGRGTAMGRGHRTPPAEPAKQPVDAPAGNSPGSRTRRARSGAMVRKRTGRTWGGIPRGTSRHVCTDRPKASSIPPHLSGVSASNRPPFSLRRVLYLGRRLATVVAITHLHRDPRSWKERERA